MRLGKTWENVPPSLGVLNHFQHLDTPGRSHHGSVDEGGHVPPRTGGLNSTNTACMISILNRSWRYSVLNTVMYVLKIRTE